MTERRGKPLPDDTVRQLRRLRLEGHSVRQIAHISGINKDTVQRYVAGLCCSAVTPKPAETPPADDVAEIDDYDDAAAYDQLFDEHEP